MAKHIEVNVTPEEFDLLRKEPEAYSQRMDGTLIEIHGIQYRVDMNEWRKFMFNKFKERNIFNQETIAKIEALLNES